MRGDAVSDGFDSISRRFSAALVDPKARKSNTEMQSRSEIGDFRVRCADCHGSNRRFEARHRWRRKCTSGILETHSRPSPSELRCRTAKSRIAASPFSVRPHFYHIKLCHLFQVNLKMSNTIQWKHLTGQNASSGVFRRVRANSHPGIIDQNGSSVGKSRPWRFTLSSAPSAYRRSWR